MKYEIMPGVKKEKVIRFAAEIKAWEKRNKGQ
jgi:hypothetical protein